MSNQPDHPRAQDVWLTPHLRPGNVRAAIPNVLARSAIFAGQPANLKNRRAFTESSLLQSVRGYQIFQQSGMQLTQAEATLWMELLRIAFFATHQPDASRIPIDVSANGLLKRLDKTCDRKNRQALRTSLQGLAAARVSVVHDSGFRWESNLINLDEAVNGSSTRIVLSVDTNLLSAYTAGYTLVNLDQRRKLRDSALGLWLHTFYSTHRNPLPLASATLQRLSGCENMRAAAWAQKLKLALEALTDATGWKCRFDLSKGTMIHVQRPAFVSKRDRQSPLDEEI